MIQMILTRRLLIQQQQRSSAVGSVSAFSSRATASKLNAAWLKPPSATVVSSAKLRFSCYNPTSAFPMMSSTAKSFSTATPPPSGKTKKAATTAKAKTKKSPAKDAA